MEAVKNWAALLSRSCVGSVWQLPELPRDEEAVNGTQGGLRHGSYLTEGDFYNYQP